MHGCVNIRERFSVSTVIARVIMNSSRLFSTGKSMHDAFCTLPMEQ